MVQTVVFLLSFRAAVTRKVTVNVDFQKQDRPELQPTHLHYLFIYSLINPNIDCDVGLSLQVCVAIVKVKHHPQSVL